MRITHIAGLDVTVRGRYMRQRCAWCGEVLCDYDLTLIGVPEGQDPTPAMWPVGAQVQVDPPMSSLIEEQRLADSSCAFFATSDTVADVTGLER